MTVHNVFPNVSCCKLSSLICQHYGPLGDLSTALFMNVQQPGCKLIIYHPCGT